MADKLSRLIETEAELDEMLEETKREAAALIEAARAEAADWLGQLLLALSGTAGPWITAALSVVAAVIGRLVGADSRGPS